VRGRYRKPSGPPEGRDSRGEGAGGEIHTCRLGVGAELLFDPRQRIERANSLPSAMDEHRTGGRSRPAPASQKQRSHSSNAVRERRHVGGLYATRAMQQLCAAGRLGSGSLPIPPSRPCPRPVRARAGTIARFARQEPAVGCNVSPIGRATKGSASWQ
jgi:hypothetical protein